MYQMCVRANEMTFIESNCMAFGAMESKCATRTTDACRSSWLSQTVIPVGGLSKQGVFIRALVMGSSQIIGALGLLSRGPHMVFTNPRGLRTCCVRELVPLIKEAS